MGPDGIVMAPPSLDQDLGFAQCVENLAIQQLIPETGVEADARRASSSAFVIRLGATINAQAGVGINQCALPIDKMDVSHRNDIFKNLHREGLGDKLARCQHPVC